MKKRMVKQLMAGAMAATMAVSMLAGCGGSDDSKGTETTKNDTTKNDTAAEEGNSDKPDTWIADRTITVQEIGRASCRERV